MNHPVNTRFLPPLYQDNRKRNSVIGGIILTRHIGAAQVKTSNIDFTPTSTQWVPDTGWASFGGTHDLYCIKVMGMVYIVGLVNRSGANAAQNTQIGTLPVGYRPRGYGTQGTRIFRTAAQTDRVDGTVSVDTTGVVIARAAVNNGAWISMTGVVFEAA